MADFDLLTTLGIYSQGRVPQWQNQDVSESLPSDLSDGVDVSEAIVTQVSLKARYDVSAFSSQVKIGVEDLTDTTYTITVDSNAVNYDASVELPSNSEALLNGIATAVNADVTVSAIVTATVIDTDSDGVGDTVLLKAVNETDEHTTEVSTSGGTGTLTATQDVTSFDAEFFLLGTNYSTVSIGWDKVNGADFSVDSKNFVERFDTSGGQRLYVMLSNIVAPSSGSTVNTPIIAIGPARDET